ncbi:MAG: urease accessory protein UreF [Burkholderiaceae bacterium]
MFQSASLGLCMSMHESELTALKSMAALLQLGSSLLPIGSFSYSQGFERAVHDGWISDQASAVAWIQSHWDDWLATVELQALSQAMMQSPARLPDLHSQFIATRDSREAIEECLQMGAALRRWLVSLRVDDKGWDPMQTESYRWLLSLSDRPAAPIAFSVCARIMGLGRLEAMMAWAWSWLENQSQCAIKIIPLGQSAGQQLLYRLLPQTLHQIDREPLARAGFAPMAAIASMRHERQYSRLYRS